MACLSYINVGIVCRVDLKRWIPEVFTLKLITTRDQVVPNTQIKTRIERMNPSVKVRARAATERLKVDAKRTVDSTAVRCEALIAEGVTEYVAWSLRENQRSVKEVCLPQVVWIVG